MEYIIYNDTKPLAIASSKKRADEIVELLTNKYKKKYTIKEVKKCH